MCFVVVGFLDGVPDGDPYAMGFFVGFGFGLTDVDVLSHGDFVFVTKFGSVVTCHGVEDQVSATTKETIVRGEKKRSRAFQNSLAKTLAEPLSSFAESLKLSRGFFVGFDGFDELGGF